MVRRLRDLSLLIPCAAAIALFATSLLGQTASDKKPGTQPRIERGREFLGLGPAPDQQAAARGQTLFVQNCGFCHGANAKGAEGPDLVRSPLVLHDEHGDQVGQVLQKGRPDRGMPAFPSFSQDQVRDIAEFLHSRIEAAANRYGYKILNVVTGDAAAGKAFFEQNCTNCHSTDKDLAHIATRFDPQDLQAQFLYPTSKESGDNRTVSVTSEDGTQISGKLKAIDDFHVVLVTKDGAVRSFPTDRVKYELQDPLAQHRELLDRYTNSDMHNVLAYLVSLK